MRAAAILVLLTTSGCSRTVVNIEVLEPASSAQIVRAHAAKTFAFAAGATDEPVCIPAGDLETDCFVGFRSQLEQATEKALAPMFAPNAGEPDYSARIEALSLTHATERGYKVYVIGWISTGRPPQPSSAS
jgi:hypothetical protein